MDDAKLFIHTLGVKPDHKNGLQNKRWALDGKILDLQKSLHSSVARYTQKEARTEWP